MVTQNKDNLWVKWVNEIYIKESTWSLCVAPSSASWAWKYACQKTLMNEKKNSEQWLVDSQFSIKQHYKALSGEGRQAPWSDYVLQQVHSSQHTE